MEEFLISIIDSDVNHLVESADNMRARRENPNLGLGLEGREKGPLEVVLDEDLRIQVREQVTKSLENEPFLMSLFECYEAEITKPREIADLLDVSVDEVNNGKKRLRLKLSPVLQEQGATK